MSHIPLLADRRREKSVLLVDRVMVSLLVISLGLQIALYHDFALDDSYITYRFAENLAEGKGLVYNPGQRVLGTTTPFYAILLAVIHRVLPVDLPQVANVLSVLTLTGGSGILYLLARCHGQPLAGMCAALLYVTSPLLVTSIGMETSFWLLLNLAGVLAFDRGCWACTGLFLALAAITRLDAILMALVLGSIYLWRYRSLPWRALLMGLLVIGPFFLGLAIYFGSPIPGSLEAKQAQAVLGFTSYARGLLGYLTGRRVVVDESPPEPRALFMLLMLLAVGGVTVTRNASWSWPLLLWGLVHAVAYVVLGVPAYHWYYAPLEPGLCLLVGLCLERAFGAARLWRWAAAALLAGLVVGQIETDVRTRQELFDPKAHTYRAVGEWLRTHTEPHARVAVMEVGLIGYYSGRPMIDLLGLIDPASRRALVRRDMLWPIAHYRPEYVVLSSRNPFYSVHLEQDAWFYEWYQPVYSQPNDEWWAAPIDVYARALPSPVRSGHGVEQGRLGQFLLLSYDLSTERARPGEWIELTLYWRREGPSAPHLRVFSHVMDDQFGIYGAHDSDIYPRRWGRSEVVSTHHFVCLDPNMSGGRYYIEVGLYHPETLRRLPALDDEGAPTGAEIIVLQEIQVDG